MRCVTALLQLVWTGQVEVMTVGKYNRTSLLSRAKISLEQ